MNLSRIYKSFAIDEKKKLYKISEDKIMKKNSESWDFNLLITFFISFANNILSIWEKKLKC